MELSTLTAQTLALLSSQETSLWQVLTLETQTVTGATLATLSACTATSAVNVVAPNSPQKRNKCQL